MSKLPMLPMSQWILCVLVQSIRYPDTAQQKNTQGKVHITALLSKNGKLNGKKQKLYRRRVRRRGASGIQVIPR